MNNLKKLITVFIAILSVFTLSVFAYSPTQQDKTTIRAFNQKISLIFQQQPQKIEMLSERLSAVKEKVKTSNPKTYYLLSEVENHINELLGKNNVNDEVQLEIVRLVEVVDGDTIKVEYDWSEKNVRLIGIDTPEHSSYRLWYPECFWTEAKQHLQSLLWDTDTIELEFDITQWMTDKYWRLLAYVWYNNKNINFTMINDWYWREYTYNLSYKYQTEFKNAQQQASESALWLRSDSTCNGERSEKKTEIEEEFVWICSEKKYCSQMDTCEEAMYYLNTCWLNRLDRDGDGTPCESICWK